MTAVEFDPPIDEATRAIYEAVAAGLNAAGAARGLPAMRWTPHHDWAPASRRSRIYGYPLTSATGNRSSVVVAQQWAQILDLVELDRDQQWAQLMERYDQDVRLWHGVVTGIRVIILVQTIEWHTAQPDPQARAWLNARLKDTRPLRTDFYPRPGPYTHDASDLT